MTWNQELKTWKIRIPTWKSVSPP
ncbi:hypothetical protein Ahy_B04g070940 isoform C [Arachis hypogaea]|uniref:Uncharacterized protein n=1 Tax=Arachis hypogaea TaxID=3818 RepID=A0A444ZJJ6_ARAHY|nr:hypothetical protein Ahy_B04g070940 isoform C [Arachis hypogaea]